MEDGSHEGAAGGEQAGLQQRGQAWALLGILHLHMVLPAGGIDPALEPTLARDSLLLKMQQSIQPQLQARLRLPLPPLSLSISASCILHLYLCTSNSGFHA